MNPTQPLHKALKHIATKLTRTRTIAAIALALACGQVAAATTQSCKTFWSKPTCTLDLKLKTFNVHNYRIKASCENKKGVDIKGNVTADWEKAAFTGTYDHFESYDTLSTDVKKSEDLKTNGFFIEKVKLDCKAKGQLTIQFWDTGAEIQGSSED